MLDTIYALSSGAAPAAIAIIRISGPRAGDALLALSGRLPKPRRASYATLTSPGSGELLDTGIILWFPGPSSATGEDLAELHLHGGRAVIAAVQDELRQLPGCRGAEPGEFTRRSFANGRLDLAEAEGLADLLAAETEMQRRTALALASGALSRQVDVWRVDVLGLSAMVEAVLDFSDEDDSADIPPDFASRCSSLADDMTRWIERPRAELLRDGFTVVLAGPPNSGKSTLFNALTDSQAAITSPIAGTTRDVISRAVALNGVPFRFVDTAGLRVDADDPIERIGVERALDATRHADVTLWLGKHGDGPNAESSVWEVAARQDADDAVGKPQPSFALSAATGAGIEELRSALVEHARASLPLPGEVALVRRQRDRLARCRDALVGAAQQRDLLLTSECLRTARVELDALLGRTGTEDMLDALFSRFCVGK